jgi:hypothetical protein
LVSVMRSAALDGLRPAAHRHQEVAGSVDDAAGSGLVHAALEHAVGRSSESMPSVGGVCWCQRSEPDESEPLQFDE